jgi:hypothetical protein
MRRLLCRLLPLLCLGLAACGSGAPSRADGMAAPVECAPFARALTGIALSGDAADWWPRAAGRYDRTHRPDVGSVLVFRRSARLPHGHVSVVSRVVSGRQVLVTQANWVRHRVTEDQPVVDVSPGGDWTSVRVWWPPSGQMGIGAYPTFGFIRPPRPLSHDRLAAGIPGAVRLAEER